MAKQTVGASEGTLLMLDPAQIEATSNPRYGLKQSRIDSLKESIVQQGRVMVPIEVHPPNGSGKYQLSKGNYRLAAVTELRKEGAADLMLPAIVVPAADSLSELKSQIAENVERESMSPMDIARAIKQLSDMGAGKPEIRETFKRPGGRKGTAVQPASNSFINMMLSFLDLPKKFQDRLHDGRLTVDGGYQATKVMREHPDKLDEVLDQAEALRLKAVEREEADEEKFLEAEKKMADAKLAEDSATEELNKAKEAAEAAKAASDALMDKTAEAYKATAGLTDSDAKKKAQEHYKALKADADAKLKLREAAEKEAKRAAEKAAKVADSAAKIREKLAEARKASPKTETGKAKKDKVSGGDVKKAAAAVGAPTGVTPLNAGEIKRMMVDLAAPGPFPKVQLIGRALRSVVQGEWGDASTAYRKMLTVLGIITSEKKNPSKPDLELYEGLKKDPTAKK